MSEYVETDFVLNVVCDHYLHPGMKAGDRVVSQVYFLPTPPGSVAGFANWREARMDADPDYPPAKSTYFDRLRSLTGSMDPEDRNAILRDPAARDRLVTSRSSRRVMQGAHWRFWCRDCTDTLEATQTSAERVFDGLRTIGREQVTFEQFRDFMRRVTAG